MLYAQITKQKCKELKEIRKITKEQNRNINKKAEIIRRDKTIILKLQSTITLIKGD